jgi:hypothetical protein
MTSLMTRRHNPCPLGTAKVESVSRLRGLVSLLWLVPAACQSSSPPPAATTGPVAPVTAPAPAAPREAPAPPLAPAAPAPDSALTLPSVERARLEYALDSAKLIGQDWPWLRADETCVLLIAPHVQWVVNCPTAPESFAQVGEPLLGRPVYASASDTIESGGQSVPSTAFIAAIPATADVPLPGDSTKGLARETPWIIASSLDGLIGAHPAFGKDTSTEEWLSVFLHEFFHTRQFLLPSFRPMLVEMKSGNIDAGALERLFKDDAGYRALVEREYAALQAAAARDAALTPEAAREVLQSWSSMYTERRAQLQKLGGEPFVRADLVLTYVEGTARYVEAAFLRDGRFHSSLPLRADPHYQDFRPFSAKPGYQGLVQRKLGARYYYAIGMHLALVLDRADPTWKKRVSEAPEWIVSLARATTTAALPRAGPK